MGRWSGSMLAMSFGVAGLKAQPAPVVAPPPTWVKESLVPSPNPDSRDLPLQFLLSSMQQRIGPSGSELYLRTVTMPQTTAGLQAIGNIAIPWNSERADLTLHHVRIRRGTEIIDLLKGAEPVVIRRENNLENSTLDGVRTVVLPAPGLQVGDSVDVAFSQRDRPGTIGAKPEAIVALADAFPIGQLERRFVIDNGVKVDWKTDPGLTALRIGKAGGHTELSYSRLDYKPTKVPTNVPLRYRFPTIQLTAYKSWDEVAAVMRPLFDTAREPASSSAILIEADAIAKSNGSPEARMLAALRLTQEKVRYVALSLGEGTHIPASADQTWTRKFGDCKGKVALLLALLDRFGITAEPLLTNSAAGALLGERLPSLAAFDHVVVRARINGRDFILDPTDYGQRSLDELASSGFAWGLPLAAGATLTRLVNLPPNSPLMETEVVWDATKGFDQLVPYVATLTYRGSMASTARAVQAGAPDRASLENYFKDAIPRIENDSLKVVAIDAETANGAFAVSFAGKAKMDWDRNIAGRRFSFDHSVPAWNIDFERADGPWKSTPVALSFPVWVRSNEAIVLPAGVAGFKLRGLPIEAQVAGTEIKRRLTLAGGRATLVADFRRLKPEITAQEARDAKPVLDRIVKDNAFIISPSNYVVTRAEVKAMTGEAADGYDGYVQRARILMDQSDRSRAIAELEKAIKVDATRPEAPALQAINYFYMSRHKEARVAVDKALAADPDNADVLRAQGLVAWRDFDSDLALRSIDRAIELDPEYHWLYSIRGQIRAGLGQYDRALADARRANELSANRLDLVARFEAASGKLEDALATLAKAEKNEDTDRTWLLMLRGNYLAQLGRSAEATTAYRAAADEARKAMIKHLPTADTIKGLGEEGNLQILKVANNFKDAELLADKAVLRQRFPSASRLAERAWLRSMIGRQDDAMHDAREALGLDPGNEQAKLALILACLRAGKFAEARAQASKALSSDASNATLLYARAAAKNGLGDRSGAADDFAKARLIRFDIMLDPTLAGLKAI